jgi:hypothetical protein
MIPERETSMLGAAFSSDRLVPRHIVSAPLRLRKLAVHGFGPCACRGCALLPCHACACRLHADADPDDGTNRHLQQQPAQPGDDGDRGAAGQHRQAC